MPITPQRFDIDAIKADFLQAATVIKRDGISSLLDYLEKSDFYSAPASEKNGVRAPTARSFSTTGLRTKSWTLKRRRDVYAGTKTQGN